MYLLFAIAASLSQTDLGDRIETFLAPYVSHGLLSGVVLVAKDDNVLFQKSYGLANEEWQLPNTLESRFCIASVTKVMTVGVTLQSVESGKLSLDDKLSKFVSGFQNGDKITIGHLLSHTAGIPHRVITDAEEAMSQTAASMAARAATAIPLSEPGSKSSYSSAGFSVLARVLEIVEGKPYHQLLQEKIFGPAGMTLTMDTSPQRAIPNRANSYVVAGARHWPAPSKDSSFLVGAGSVWSTPGDLFKFLRSMESGKLGSALKARYADRPELYFNGLTNEYRAYIYHERKSGNTLIFCGNTLTGAADALLSNIPKILAGESPVGEVPKVTAYASGLAELKDCEGRFRFDFNGQEVSVETGEGILLIGGTALLPIGRDKFFAYRDFGTVEAERDASGKVARLLWTSLNGQKAVLTRV